jgi:hypothetical protein
MSRIYKQSNQLSQPKKKDTTYLHQYRGFPISMIKVNSNISITGYLIKTQRRRRIPKKYHKHKQEHKTRRKRKGKRKQMEQQELWEQEQRG